MNRRELLLSALAMPLGRPRSTDAITARDAERALYDRPKITVVPCEPAVIVSIERSTGRARHGDVAILWCTGGAGGSVQITSQNEVQGGSVYVMDQAATVWAFDDGDPDLPPRNPGWWLVGESEPEGYLWTAFPHALPALASVQVGFSRRFKNTSTIDNGTINADGTDQILDSGSSSLVLAPLGRATLYSDGSQWLVVG